MCSHAYYIILYYTRKSFISPETRFLMLHISSFNFTQFDFKVTHSV